MRRLLLLAALAAASCSPPPEPAVAPVTTSLVSTPAPPLEPAPKAANPLDDVLAGIKVISPTERIATRHAVDTFLAHKERLLGTLNGEVVMTDGKPSGLRLYGIAPNTLASAVGFENGDRFVALNGKPVLDDGLPELLALIDRSFRSNEIEFDIVRKGQPMKLLVHVDSVAK